LVEKQIDTEETLALIGLKQGDLDAVDEALCTASALLERHSEERLDSFASAGLRSRFANWGGIAQESAAGHVHACEAVHSDCSAALTEGWRRTGDWKARELFDRLRARSDDTQRADDATRTGTTQSHETIQASMPRVSVRTALVEYVDGLDTLYAYVVLSDAIRLVELGPRAPIELRARRFVEEIASTDATPVAILEDGGWLYQQLIEPVRKFLPLEVAALTVIPTAALAIVPFDALVKPAPHLAGRTISFDDLPFLIDDYCVTYAPSSPVLAELEQRASNERPPRFLILADPGYDAEMQTGSIEKHPHRTLYSYGRLERTRDEAFEIARLLLVGNTSTTDTGHRRLNEIQSERSPSMSTSSFDMYLGEQATPEVLRTDLRGYTNLHFALHGEVDPADPRRSGLLLSRSDASDGLLTLEEILNLRLDADLVVLSACDTARGPIVRGEGVESIAWGFLHAGARAVLATHWAVRDSDAVVIMRKMYDFHFQRRLPYAEALREAKLEYRRSREPRGKSPRGTQGSIASTAADPYFWSAFLLVGTAPH
jgi:CHAT domain-containing protein